MASGCEQAVEAEAEPQRWSWRDAGPWGWGLVLLAEVLFVTFRFDAAAFSRHNQWWSGLLHESPQFLRIGITVAAMLLLISSRGWQELMVPVSVTPSPRRRWVWILAHLMALYGFIAVSAMLFNAGQPDDSAWLPVSLAWWVLGGLTLATWALMARSVDFWLVLFRRGKGMLLTAAIVGMVAYALGNFTMRLWHPLSAWTFEAVNLILGGLLRNHAIEPARFVIRTPAFAVEISRQCSGYEGIGLVSIFLSTYLWLFRRQLRFPHALLILPLAVLVVWVLNVFRIAALVILGDAGLGELAKEGFHSEAGWLAFNAVALGFAAMADRSPFFRVDGPGQNGTSPTQSDKGASATTVHVAPFLAMLAAGMAARACGATPAGGACARIGAAVAVLWVFRRAYLRMGWGFSWTSIVLGLATGLAWIGLGAWFVGHMGMAIWLRGTVPPSRLAVLCHVLSYTVVAPVVEELAFRRYLARRIVSIEFEQIDARQLPWIAVALSSLLFGILHGSGWLPATGAGVVYVLAFRRRGQLSDAVLAHALTNVVIAGHVIVTGQWSLWS